MSTGLWFAYPHRATASFFEDLLRWLVYKVEQPWDQAAFNEVPLPAVAAAFAPSTPPQLSTPLVDRC